MAYTSPIGTFSIPTQTHTDNLGMKTVSAGGIYKMDSKTGQLVPADINYSSSDGLVGNFSWPKQESTLSKYLSAVPPTASAQPQVVNSKTAAETAYDKAIATLSGGADAAKAASASVLERIAGVGNDLSAARSAASGMNMAIGGVENSAMSLGSYADILRNLGLGTVGIGDAIIRGDRSTGGLASEFLNAIGLASDAALKINPDRYVSQAASDVQSSFSNARDQAMRELSRRGVSATSGAAGALQRQFATTMATALATAKTKARQLGLSERANALASRASLFKDALATGASLQQQGAENIGTAANIVAKQGDLFATAGNLASSQVGAYANIAGVEVNLGNLEVSNAKMVQESVNSVAEMQAEMARYYGEAEPKTVEERGSRDGHYYYGTTTTTRG